MAVISIKRAGAKTLPEPQAPVTSSWDLHIRRRDEPHLVAQLADFTAPEMGTATGFHGNDARRHLTEKGQDLVPAQLLANDRVAGAINSMHLKHVLRQIQTDCSNFRHDRPPMLNVTNPPWHTDAVWGRLYHHRPMS